MPGWGEAVIMYYALAAGLRTVMERYWSGLLLVPPDFVRCQSGLWLGFWVFLGFGDFSFEDLF